MATGSLYIGFVMQVGFGVVQFLGEVLPKFLRKFWWNFPKAGPIAGAVLSIILKYMDNYQNTPQ